MKGRLQLLRAYPEVTLALRWLLVTRATLWLIGLVSREVLQPFLPQQEPGTPFTENPFLAGMGTLGYALVPGHCATRLLAATITLHRRSELRLFPFTLCS